MTVRDLLEKRKDELVQVDISSFTGSTFPYDGRYEYSYRGWLGGVPECAAYLNAPVLEVIGDSDRLNITYAACSMRNAVDKTEVIV